MRPHPVLLSSICLTPVYAVVQAMLLIGEKLAWYGVALLLVVPGLLLVNRTQHTTRRSLCSTHPARHSRPAFSFRGSFQRRQRCPSQEFVSGQLILRIAETFYDLR